MSYRKAIKDAKVALKEANRVRTKKVSVCTYNFRKAKKAFAEQEHLFQEAYDKELLIARCAGLSLYPDRITGEGHIHVLSRETGATFNKGGDVIYESFGSEKSSRITRADLNRADTRAIFLTITSPEGRFTVQGKPEEEAAAYHFVDAVYNATRRLDELAKEKEEKLAKLQPEFAALDASKALVETARAALQAAEADTASIEAAEQQLAYLQYCAKVAGLDSNGRTAAQRALRWIVPFAVVSAALILLFFGTLWSRVFSLLAR